jgi:glycosyltransferase involved in cell wall biosynthesis
MKNKISIILPSKNEASSLQKLLPKLCSSYEDAEIIIVNDGSIDNTLDVCEKYKINVINHPYSKGNGSAIKTGARAATGDILVFMDADGQHKPEDIKLLIQGLEEGYDMVVGARDFRSHTSLPRYFANMFYNYISRWMTGYKVLDLTSGFRAIRTEIFKKYIYLLPNGFSYPTTITMAILRNGYSLHYVPININKRIGSNSHLKIIKDGIRFLLIIFKIGTLYSPLKLFFPISFLFFLLGMFNYVYTFTTEGRFTNMSALLLVTSVLVFLIGLISEQLTALMYSVKSNDSDKE